MGCHNNKIDIIRVGVISQVFRNIPDQDLRMSPNFSFPSYDAHIFLKTLFS
jgi:aminoglycoside N3'-acetyltransferase